MGSRDKKNPKIIQEIDRKVNDGFLTWSYLSILGFIAIVGLIRYLMDILNIRDGFNLKQFSTNLNSQFK